mgnify:CR=1 FL=1
MSQKNETKLLVLSLLITAGLLGAGFWWFTSKSGVKLDGLSGSNSGESGSVSQPSERLQGRLSLGDKILVAADTTPQKQEGVKAFAAGDFAEATTQLQSSLQVNRNDPEALIYLNNAKTANSNPLKIAVSVPIGGNLNVAKEMLRGVAQAQDEVNKSGGINGSLLQVEIANDDNNPAIAKQVAAQFVQDGSILAVVGHNSSEASLAASSEYRNGKLVMISPTSDAKDLSGIGNYIFRTIPSIRFQAESLANYAVKTARKTNSVVCLDSNSPSSQSLKDEFTSAMSNQGGKVVPIDCNLAASNFNAGAVISQAISQGADSILLLPSVDRITQALDVAQANQRRLSLLGSSTLYTIQTLQQGQSAVNGMVLAVAWHPQAFPGNPFARNAVQLWGGEVNWRSATAYDAVQAIVSGLRQSQTRQELQKALSSPGFSVNGATGAVQFSSGGDRNGAAILVQIEPGQISNTGFDFVPLKP